MYIDTHFHLGSDSYDDPEKVLEQAQENDVTTFIVSGCNRREMDEVLALAKGNEHLFVTIGYHPENASTVTEEDLSYLEKKLASSSVVGIGEIGLDYHYGKENIDQQKALFRAQLSFAEKYHLPVVIHTRDAIQDTYDILKDYNVTGVLHCFNESIEMANRFLKLGFYFGIGGVITFKNSKLYQTVEQLPLDRIVLETDSPYLAPEPYRGHKNGPWNIPIIAKKIADVKNIDVTEVAKITSHNAKQLFDLNKKL